MGWRKDRKHEVMCAPPPTHAVPLPNLGLARGETAPLPTSARGGRPGRQEQVGEEWTVASFKATNEVPTPCPTSLTPSPPPLLSPLPAAHTPKN